MHLNIVMYYAYAMFGIKMVSKTSICCPIVVGEAKRSLRCVSSLLMVMFFYICHSSEGSSCMTMNIYGSLWVRVGNHSFKCDSLCMYECFKDCRFEFICV